MILLTGGTGFLGKAVQRVLSQGGYAYDAPGRVGVFGDSDVKYTGMIHMAGLVGGIQENMARPADFIRENVQLGIRALEYARTEGIKRFVNVSSACAYPERIGGSSVGLEFGFKLTERHMWGGRPQETHAAYGIGKRVVTEMVDAYHKQYGIDGFSVVLANVYGPGVRYDKNRAHVIPALIEKMVEAKEMGNGEVKCFGTGEQSREFLYVDDAARAIVKLYAEHGRVNGWDGANGLINVGSGYVCSIRAVAEAIKGIVGYKGILVWDTGMSDGNKNREVDSTLIKKMGWKPEVEFRDGLKRVVEDFYAQRVAA